MQAWISIPRSPVSTSDSQWKKTLSSNLLFWKSTQPTYKIKCSMHNFNVHATSISGRCDSQHTRRKSHLLYLSSFSVLNNSKGVPKNSCWQSIAACLDVYFPSFVSTFNPLPTCHTHTDILHLNVSKQSRNASHSLYYSLLSIFFLEHITQPENLLLSKQCDVNE